MEVQKLCAPSAYYVGVFRIMVRFGGRSFNTEPEKYRAPPQKHPRCREYYPRGYIGPYALVAKAWILDPNRLEEAVTFACAVALCVLGFRAFGLGIEVWNVWRGLGLRLRG